MYILYKYDRRCSVGFSKIEDINNRFYIYKFHLKLASLYPENESKSIGTTIFRIYISILTFNKVEIYYVLTNNGEIIHTAYTISKNIKYPFLNRGDISIGPCCTKEEYRGMGIYPMVIRYIINDNIEKNKYMFVREDNISSIKGVEKVGFKKCVEQLDRTKILHRFIKKI